MSLLQYTKDYFCFEMLCTFLLVCLSNFGINQKANEIQHFADTNMKQVLQEKKNTF